MNELKWVGPNKKKEKSNSDRLLQRSLAGGITEYEKGHKTQKTDYRFRGLGCRYLKSFSDEAVGSVDFFFPLFSHLFF